MRDFLVFSFEHKAQNKKVDITENLSFSISSYQTLLISLLYLFPLFLLAEFAISFFNFYFRDFHDFSVFDLALNYSYFYRCKAFPIFIFFERVCLILLMKCYLFEIPFVPPQLCLFEITSNTSGAIYQVSVSEIAPV